jgi:hypothetical protein
MMEYSGALGGEGGGSQRLCVRRVDERVERREERGSMWDSMSEADGSRVRRSMPELMSWVYVELEYVDGCADMWDLRDRRVRGGKARCLFRHLL